MEAEDPFHPSNEEVFVDSRRVAPVRDLIINVVSHRRNFAGAVCPCSSAGSKERGYAGRVEAAGVDFRRAMASSA
jgi:hypothetical protein